MSPTATEQESPVKLQHHDHVIIASFENCVRCGDVHHDLDFTRFDAPMDVGGVQFTHWALCPSNETPILLKVDTLSA